MFVFYLQELPREYVLGPAIIWPAKAGRDFRQQEGQLTFDVGRSNTSVDIYLTPDLASSLPTPRRFQVELYNPTGGARVHPQFGVANVTLVSNEASQAVWVLLDQLHQPLDTVVLNQVLQELTNKVNTPLLTQEQMTAVLEALEKVCDFFAIMSHINHSQHICEFIHAVLSVFSRPWSQNRLIDSLSNTKQVCDIATCIACESV